MENPTKATVIPFPTTGTEDNTSKIQHTQDEAERIKHLKNSQQKITKIQKDLEILIDAMAENPSILSRASTFWGNVPLWQKIVAGLVLIAPPLVLGIFTSLITCIVIGVCTLLAYVGASVILDDHHSHSKNNTKNIKTGVLSLAESLEIIMQSLKEIGSALTEQVSLFEKENELFSAQIKTLEQRNQELSEQITQLQATELTLRNTVLALEKTEQELKASTAHQTALLEENQEALKKARIDYGNSQKQLQETTDELKEVRKQFATEIEKQRAISEALRAGVNAFTEIMDASEDEKEAFQEKIKDFIKNKETSFLSIIKRFGAAEEELAVTRARLHQVTDLYEQQVIRGDEQVARLTKIHGAPDITASLGQHGFYAAAKTAATTDVHKIAAPGF